jgi:hypothetical protein
MAQSESVFRVLAQLILRDNVPLHAVAIAGEAIAADARRLDADSEAPTKHRSDRGVLDFLESYESIRRRCEALFEAFSERRNVPELVRELSEIRDELIGLS